MCSTRPACGRSRRGRWPSSSTSTPRRSARISPTSASSASAASATTSRSCGATCAQILGVDEAVRGGDHGGRQPGARAGRLSRLPRRRVRDRRDVRHDPRQDRACARAAACRSTTSASFAPSSAGERITIAVIAVPARPRRRSSIPWSRAGIKAVLNFSPGGLQVPPEVKLKSMDLTVSLESLSFFLAQGEDSDMSARRLVARRSATGAVADGRRVRQSGDRARSRGARPRSRCRARALRLIRSGANKKGDPLQTARLAGIMAAKRTADLIPLCHPLQLSLRRRHAHAGPRRVRDREPRPHDGSHRRRDGGADGGGGGGADDLRHGQGGGQGDGDRRHPADRKAWRPEPAHSRRTVKILVAIYSPFAVWNIPRRYVDRLRREFPAHTFLHAR